MELQIAKHSVAVWYYISTSCLDVKLNSGSIVCKKLHKKHEDQSIFWSSCNCALRCDQASASAVTFGVLRCVVGAGMLFLGRTFVSRLRTAGMRAAKSTAKMAA